MHIEVDIRLVAPHQTRTWPDMSDCVKHHLNLGRVGHDSGQLVLHLERRLARPSAQVRQALTALGRRDNALSSEGPGGAERVERWEVDDERSGSRLAFTAWIDAADVQTAGDAGAEYHDCFNRLVRVIEQGTAQGRSDDADVTLLAEAYRSAFAAALADTD